jgi:hypothetical protein
MNRIFYRFSLVTNGISVELFQFKLLGYLGVMLVLGYCQVISENKTQNFFEKPDSLCFYRKITV